MRQGVADGGRGLNGLGKFWFSTNVRGTAGAAAATEVMAVAPGKKTLSTQTAFKTPAKAPFAVQVSTWLPALRLTFWTLQSASPLK